MRRAEWRRGFLPESGSGTEYYICSCIYRNNRGRRGRAEEEKERTRRRKKIPLTHTHFLQYQ